MTEYVTMQLLIIFDIFDHEITTWVPEVLLCLKMRIGPIQEVNNFSSDLLSTISFSCPSPWKINICDAYGKNISIFAADEI